jgi:RimJ/RimL family protein N-acetyltransferase
MDAVLHTDRLEVRLWSLDDADDAYSIYGDPDIARYVPGSTPGDPSQSRHWLEQRVRNVPADSGLGFWALVEKDTGRIVGGVTLEPHDAGPSPEVRLGFHLSTAAHEQGYGEEVAHALVRYGFNELQLSRIVAVVLPEDLTSRRVLEKVGLADESEGLLGDTHVQIMAIHRALDGDDGPLAPPPGTAFSA